MANIKDVTEQMLVIKRQIEKVFSISQYLDYDDLSGLEIDWDNPDEMLLVAEYRKALEELSDVQSTLNYLSRPIRETSRLNLNSEGRYETEGGHYYTCGQCIEYLAYNDSFEREEWRISRIEHNGCDYYIVGENRDMLLNDLKVRVRER